MFAFALDFAPPSSIFNIEKGTSVKIMNSSATSHQVIYFGDNYFDVLFEDIGCDLIPISNPAAVL